MSKGKSNTNTKSNTKTFHERKSQNLSPVHVSLDNADTVIEGVRLDKSEGAVKDKAREVVAHHFLLLCFALANRATMLAGDVGHPPAPHGVLRERRKRGSDHLLHLPEIQSGMENPHPQPIYTSSLTSPRILILLTRIDLTRIMPLNRPLKRSNSLGSTDFKRRDSGPGYEGLRPRT